MHKFYLVGVIQKIGNVFTTKTGNPNVYVDVFCRTDWIDKYGQPQAKSSIFSVQVFGQEKVEKIHNAELGTKVFIEGHLNSYEKQGEKGLFYNVALQAAEIHYFTYEDTPPPQEDKDRYAASTRIQRVVDRPETRDVDDDEFDN